MTTGDENPSLQVTADHRIELREAPIKKPGKGQVLIHVKATGVCGSDVHFWKHGAIGELKVLGDCILGHEAAGQVIQVGEGVENVKVNDRVAIEPGIPCGKCFLCDQGDYNLCEDVEFIGVYPYDGSIQRYFVHDARYVYKLPESMSYAEGALVEPVSVAYHGIERAKLKLGEGVLIAGAGPIGLVAMLLARSFGCCPVVLTDISADRLAFAKKIAPEITTFQISMQLSPKENAAKVRGVFGPGEHNAPLSVLECTGVENSILTCSYVTRRSGTLMIIGVGRDYINNFPFMHLSLAEIDIRFINRYHGTWPTVIKLISSSVIDVKPLVSHRFLLKDAVKALTVSADPHVHSIKVVIED